MKKYFGFFLLFLFVFISSDPFASPGTCLSITGLVRQPLNLTMEDMVGFQNVTVQLNEIMKDGTFKGVFYYRGVPLRTLLDMAFIEKEETAFSKKTDIAILARGRDGKEVALSWGEIFYRNSSDIIIATSASPVMPHKNCASCHDAGFYKPYMDQLSRHIGFPKLVVADDAYSDRSIEDIVSIKVIDPRPRKPAVDSDELYSPGFTIRGDVTKEMTITDLSSYQRVEERVKLVGEGKGFHGIKDFSGTPLKAILDLAGVDQDLTKVFLVSAPDGYYALFSYGEIFLNRDEESIIVAEKANNEPIEDGGKFFLIPTEDLMADRDVKSVGEIEVFTLKKDPRLFIIGMGSGDTNLITMEAVSTMAEADVFICPDDIKERFSKYLGDKPILLDIYEFAPPVMRKKYPDLSQEEVNKLVNDKYAEITSIIEKEIDDGRNVALLDYGDPTIWSGSEYIMEHSGDDMIEIIPGLSSFNVANALLETHVGCNGSIILTTPAGINGNRSLFESAAKNGETLCLFMGGQKLSGLMDFFYKHYPETTPVQLVYRAGYMGSEKVVKIDLKRVREAVEKEEEKNLVLIYIGPCLESENAMEH